MKPAFHFLLFLLLALAAAPTPGYSSAAKVVRPKKAVAVEPAQGSRPGSARGRSTATKPPVKSVPQTHRQSKPLRVEAGARSSFLEARSARGERTERTARSARSSRGSEGSRSIRGGGSSSRAGAGSSRGHGRGH
ncbi:hypothetical protein LGH70_09925 [Hymenobacter sp. BT635]|uniref:Translation initiation factor IF-2 n=1 Tax=Hymenobacter nitidus TaxID=2880929 RepID=A0ABS8AF91_9BACT|nr:hypothetical protein [Hymenobacter nitidus]MCB2377900.1 hypothetical protein [Hymenobacter nitidus]